MSHKPVPHVTRIIGMRGLLVNNFVALRSAVLAGETTIIITSNLDLDDARRIVAEEHNNMSETMYYG
jgi:hypothetical protein